MDKRNKAGDVDESLTKQSGIFYNNVYLNDKNVPMVEYTMTQYRGHNCIPEEMWALWDDWFSKFSRETDGSVSYMNDGIVKPKIDSH